MTRFARIAIVGLVALSFVIEFFVPAEDARKLDATTYGTMQWGYRAVYDLLAELGGTAGRFQDDLAALPAGATAWWLAPAGLCAEADAPSDAMSDARAWVDAGGTGVLFLAETAPATTCSLGDLALPVAAPHRAAGDVATGLGHARKIANPKLRTFARVDDSWIVRAEYAGEPFVVEHALGRGRVVAVADVRILQNGTLGDHEIALFDVDLVRAFGIPHIVEAVDHAGWTASSRSAIAYLVASPALALFAGLVLTGVLAAWRGGLVPSRTVDADPIPAPTLQTFVSSLARLYAGSHDYERLLARYRDLTARRLRRHLGLPANASLDAVATRIERVRPSVRDAHALLAQRLDATSADALHAAVGRLDALAAHVIG